MTGNQKEEHSRCPLGPAGHRWLGPSHSQVEPCVLRPAPHAQAHACVLRPSPRCGILLTPMAEESRVLAQRKRFYSQFLKLRLVGAVDHWKCQVLVFVFVVKLRLSDTLSSLSVVSSHFSPPYSLTPSSSPNKFSCCCERPGV